MDVSVENTSSLGRRLKVSVPGETVSHKIKIKMAKLAKDAHIKGFRKGKVPAKVLEQRFGESVRSEVVNELIRQTFTEVVKEKHLEPAGTPKIEDIKNEASQNLEFTASFEVFPQITLTDFSNFEIEKRTAQISAQDVENMIAKLQDQLANWEKVERSVKNGDKITVDFARLLKEPGSEKEVQNNVQMIIGAEGVLPGLDEAIIGKSCGDEIEVNLTYPEDWAETQVANKAVTLWVKLHEIFEKHLLSKEELAKKLGIENEDLGQLAEKVQARMQEELTQVLNDEIKESVLEKLLEKNPIELPQSLIAQEKEAIHREMNRMRRGKVTQELLDSPEVAEQAKHRVELGLLLNEVIKTKGLKAEPSRVRAEIQKIALRFPKPAEIMEAYFKNNELLYSVERMVLLEQAVEAILKEAKLTEKIVSFDEVMNVEKQ